MRWTSIPLGALGLCLFAAAALAEEIKGTFIGPGVYATPEGCVKWKAVEAGGDRNIETVPDVLTEDGFKGWEGACTFRSIIEMEPGKMWKASMDCHEGATEGPETDIFEKMPDGSLKMTIMDSATTLVRCDADKGN